MEMNRVVTLTGEQIAEAVEEILRERGHEINLMYRTVWKNNAELKALTIRKNSGMSPTLYFTDESPEQLADEILKVTKECSDPGFNFDIESIFSHQYFSNHLRPRLIPDTELNRKGLEDSKIEWIPFGDTGLIILLEVTLESRDSSTASFQVSRVHLDQAGYTFTEALDRAIENLTGQMMIKSMKEVMAKISGLPAEAMDEIFSDDSCPMWVVTTNDTHYGAACLLSKECFKVLSERVGVNQFYILPSSVHEVIAVPKTIDFEISALLDMVREINETQVEPQERLGDAVYELCDGILRKVA